MGDSKFSLSEENRKSEEGFATESQRAPRERKIQRADPSSTLSISASPATSPIAKRLTSRFFCPLAAMTGYLARKIHDFRNTEGLAMVQIRYLGRFETKNEAFA
jgi:hypothetical protein